MATQPSEPGELSRQHATTGLTDGEKDPQLVIAGQEAEATLKELEASVDKTRAEGRKIDAEAEETEASADKTRAEARKVDAEAKESEASAEKILAEARKTDSETDDQISRTTAREQDAFYKAALFVALYAAIGVALYHLITDFNAVTAGANGALFYLARLFGRWGSGGGYDHDS